MRRAARRDENEQQIVDVAKRHASQTGNRVTIEYLSGSDLPDLLVGYRGWNLLIEVKNPDGKNRGALRPGQLRWHARWAGEAHIVSRGWEVENIMRDVDAIENLLDARNV